MDLLQRQKNLEYSCAVLGRDKFLEKAAADPSGAPAGAEQLRRTLPELAKAIAEFQQTSRPGRRHTAQPFLAWIDPEQAAYLTIRYGLDAAAANQTLTSTAAELGGAVEDHVNLLDLEKEAPPLFRKVFEQLKKSTAARHRVGVLRHVVRKYGKNQLLWTTDNKIQVGVKLLDLLQNAATWLERGTRPSRRGHKPAETLQLTPEGRAWLEDVNGNRAWFYPIHKPMLVPPRPWSQREIETEDGPRVQITGGYLTSAIRRAPLIQRPVSGAVQRAAQGDLSAVYSAINAVQSTGWRVNAPLLKVMEDAWASGPGLQRLLVPVESPIPARPENVPADVEMKDLGPSEREALIEWCGRAAAVHEENARIASKRSALMLRLAIAREFAEERAIYFPHYVDFRGRMYPYAAHLNPQSEDTGRGLLEFAVGKPLGERGLFWLKVHTANVFGIDKVSFEERVKWVNEHMEEIHDSAVQPLDGQMFWAAADSPWSALAACMELAGAAVAGPAYVSHVPLAMDGSCSGLQHYSAMLRDPVGGASVNLVPQQKPGDIYTQVANRAQVLSDVSGNGMSPYWVGKVVRGIAKQPTMTLCYSATIFGMQGQIRKAVVDLGGEDYLGGAQLQPACAYMAHTVWGAIGDVVIAARDAMNFLKACSDIAASENLPICWTAPNGFRVEQSYMQEQADRIDVFYQGEHIELRLTKETTNIHQRKQAAGIAPNFVHSLDSAHLMATVNLGLDNDLTYWAVIHDSFGTHAADVDVLHACIREAFIDQYTPNVLERFRNELIEQLPPDLVEKVPPVPPQGTLDLAAVRESSYFFA